MTALFLVAAGIVFYAYLGYPLLLAIMPRKYTRTDAGGAMPRVSVILAVHNAQQQVLNKLNNLTMLEYPADRLEIIVVSDGSSDGTAEAVRCFRSAIPIRLAELSERVGKAAALNHAVSLATGDLLFMVDVRQTVARSALKSLLCHFEDPTVGAVSGELVFVDEDDTGKPAGVGVYWKIEKLVRKMESLTGSVIGVTGAVYAVRRQLVPKLPPDLILDDVYIPMHVIKAGKRVLFDSGAVATDRLAPNHRSEFNRKVRTLYGNLQMVEFAPWMLWPGYGGWARLVSHKLLRLIVPFAMCAMLVISGLSHTVYFRVAFWLQILGYALAAVPDGVPSPRVVRKLSLVCRTFVVLNLAALIGLVRFVIRKPVSWKVTSAHAGVELEKAESERATA